jgi:hypothetical protein
VGLRGSEAALNFSTSTGWFLYFLNLAAYIIFTNAPMNGAWKRKT